MATSFPSEKNIISLGFSYSTLSMVLSNSVGHFGGHYTDQTRHNPDSADEPGDGRTILRGVWDVGLTAFSSHP